MPSFMAHCLKLLGEHEVTSINSVGGLTLYVGINPQKDPDDLDSHNKATILVSSALPPTFTATKEASKQAALACIKLFLEGDEGNEDLYPLAEPLQPKNPDLRFIP